MKNNIDKIIEELEELYINKVLTDEELAHNRAINNATEIVKKYENNGWILCSNILPEKESLFCNKYNNFLIGYGYKDNGSCTGFSAESGYALLMDAVAWCELPQPYKGEQK